MTPRQHCEFTTNIQHLNGDLELLVPDLIYTELGNAVWKKRMRGLLEYMDAQEIINRFEALILQGTPTANLLRDAYRLAVKYGQTVYDAMYLALSEREGCKFVTSDVTMYDAVKADMPNVVMLTNWPENGNQHE